MESENDVVTNLSNVRERISEAMGRRKESVENEKDFAITRLVAVSKTKPAKLIIDCYQAGQRHFGENYAQEFSEKSNDPEIQEMCPDIQWHFIGPIQSNKAKMIVKCPRLFMIETVNSTKLADMLNKCVGQEGKTDVKVLVQVNTSGESQKSGEDAEGTVALCRHITTNCQNLKLTGLMTIGAFDHDLASGPNPDFQCLLATRQRVCDALSLTLNDLELSMGMSNDFEHAIEVGSTNVRVGSTIFGARAPKKT